MTRYRPARPSLPKRHVENLHDIQQRQTVRRMLDQGGIVTPIGPNTHIRLPAPLNGFGTFPSAMVEEVQRSIAERLRNSAEAKA